MKIALGIDPDTKDMAIASWDGNGPRSAQVVHLVGVNKTGEQSQVRMARAMAEATPCPTMHHPSIIAIEGQQIDKRRARPADLFTLAHTTGSALSWCAHHFDKYARIVIPTPKEWKGQVAKHAMQGRLYLELGWGSTIIGTGTSRYARPNNPTTNFKHISPGQWKHIGDALLLAKYAYEL